MTDFRRPDLDLWEEEEDGEDGRPTIVSERPTPMLSTKGSTKAGDATIPFGTIQSDRKTPDVQRSSLVQRLIEQGALDQDESARNSSEELRDSEIDVLKLPADGELEASSAKPALVIEGVETEPGSEDQIPTVSVKRPLPPLPVALAPANALTRSGAGSDREVTERISIPTGMIGSIAPATRTFRPDARERKGLPLWQTALAAVALLGGGMSIAKFRAEQQGESSAGSAQGESGSADLASAQLAEPRLEAPASAAPASVAVQEGPPAAPAAPTPPSAQPAAEQALNPVSLPSAGPAGPPAIEPIQLPKPSDSAPVSRTRYVRERTALAKAEPNPSEERARAQGALLKPAISLAATPTGSLPPHPSREQVSSSLDAITAQLQKCVGDRHGVADVTVTVRPAGFVSYAVVSGEYAGTSEGSCIARAVRNAKFPAFSEPMLRVTYPFKL